MSEPTNPVPEPARGNGRHDVTTHRIVVVGLVLAVLTSVVGIIGIDMLGREVPPSLPAIGGTALGALNRLRNLMKQSRYRIDQEALTFLTEAEALLAP
jgi:hypothetical protein